MALSPYYIIQRGLSPIVAAAVHNGHDTDPRYDSHFAVGEDMRLRQEDPCTAEWAQIAKIQIVGVRSRFEVDLNRPRHQAIYQSPEDAWGMHVWERPLNQNLIEAALRKYDEFYGAVDQLLRGLIDRYGRIVIYDLHNYNYMTSGAQGPPSDPIDNPEVNIGTGTMNRQFWAPVVDQLIHDLRSYDFPGKPLDVRENVKFQGGYFGKWIHETFPEHACAIAIEFKKFFMDEWTGARYHDEVEHIYRCLKATLPGVRRALERV